MQWSLQYNTEHVALRTAAYKKRLGSTEHAENLMQCTTMLIDSGSNNWFRGMIVFQGARDMVSS